MGIESHFVEALIREAQYQPIGGDVILIGRQTVYFSPDAILNLLKQHGIDTAKYVPSELETSGTSNVDLREFANQKLITDRQLFRLLGVPNVLALDHSDYEGAEIIHDLTRPIPDRLKGSADFIADGSTLDNVFDPVTVITNFSDMLRPGGRLIMANMFSNHFEPYVILPPLWYLDYFTMNGFADCKVYIIVYGKDVDTIGEPAEVFTINLDMLIDPDRRITPFFAYRIMAAIVFAEKGVKSTSHLRPIQQHYRSAKDWLTYRANLASIRQNPRPHLVRSRGPISLQDVRGGHLFMADDFSARDPRTEILRTLAAE